MSIEKNYGNAPFAEPSASSAESALRGLEAARGAEARLAEVVDVIKVEFSGIMDAMARLDGVEIDEMNFEKLLFVADRLGTLAEISPSLASRPDVRKKFDAAIRFVTSEFIRVGMSKIPSSSLDEAKKREFDSVVKNLGQSLEALGPDVPPHK